MSDQLTPRPSLLRTGSPNAFSLVRRHWPAIATAAAVIAGLVAAFYSVQAWVEGRVEAKISDPGFLAKLSDRVRPDLIIDNHGSILVDRGAMEYIDDISVTSKADPDFGEFIGKLVITPKKFMALPPLVSAADGSTYAITSKRGVGLKWEFELSYALVDAGEKGPHPVRVEIINR